MREALDRLLKDLTLITLALGFALGWALLQFAEGVSNVITTLLNDYEEVSGNPDLLLTWRVGEGHLLSLGQLLEGSIELAVVLAVAAFVRSRQGDSNFAKPSVVPPQGAEEAAAPAVPPGPL